MMSKFLLQLNERRYQQKKTAKGYQIKPYNWYVIWMVLLLIAKEDFNDRKGWQISIHLYKVHCGSFLWSINVSSIQIILFSFPHAEF